ncbi:NADH:ubiquinone oxidoreductase [Pseudomonas sp. PDM14]|uniref:NADH:ubiquinone oxidoreductase n=1 Tax=Pseudomonas sp. PDM14 TaxID=2769288 RepID=UPI00177B5516|nr:NADH:ubiquinone oxidoreductase [Pseudomonas sp. PDM14]MBD9483229.1 NADH:ubiquinone oxidoreductase [Pseudomonas sp. PDM14]
MRAIAAVLMTLALAGQAWGEACVVTAQGNQVDVKVCQQNRTIPPNLFRSGFCQPQLQGQKVDVIFAEQCPIGAFGECRNAKVVGTPYQQDIHYYGVATDARYLKPACEQQSKGVWMAR